MMSRIFGFVWLQALLAALPVSAQQGPVIEHIEPTSGPPGTVVAVVGRYFPDGSRVSLGGKALPVDEVLPGRITVQVPDGSVSGPIAVDAATGHTVGPRFRVTARLPAPRVVAIEPTSGPPGSHVTLRGENFSPRLTHNLVSLAGAPVLVRSATPGTLQVTVPEAASSGPFLIRVPQAGEARSEQSFTVTAGTAIRDFEPRRGGPGSEVVLHGSGFSPQPADNRVYLNNVAVVVSAASATRLTVQVPRGAVSGKLLVDVRNAGRAFTPEAFVVQHPPQVLDFSPGSGLPGTLIHVRGTGFGTDPGVVDARLGDTPLVARQARDTGLVLELIEGAASGKLSIRVNGVGPAWSDADFEVLSPLSITAIEPRGGPVGSVLTLRGTGFDARPSRNAVRIGRREAVVIEASETQLSVRVPASGGGPVTVTAGGRVARSVEPFVVTSPPRIRKVMPLQAPIGSEISIRGRGFGDRAAVVKVSIGGVPLEVRSVHDDAVTARIPPGAASGPVDVEVALQGRATSSERVVVLSNLVVTSAEPARARVGEAIELRGKGFDGPDVRVDFGGVPSAPESVTPERIRVLVPRGARSGLVTVHLGDGRSAPSPVSFGVVPE